MKYNERISDYNSENQKSKDFQRIGNIVFNKGVSNDETKAAWLSEVIQPIKQEDLWHTKI